MIASNETFVVAAYALTWVVLLGYLWRLRSKAGRPRAGDSRAAGREGDSR